MTVDPHLGRTLGDRYRIDALIGRGGMSTVYHGFDAQLQRPVAIKIFQPGADDDARWESEVRLLSQLSHPNLVTLHDAHLEPAGSSEPSYLVMEYIAGPSLQQHLAEFGSSAPLAALIIVQIGEALAAVHARGIVHRDLKPGNILLEPSDLPPLHVRAKLADFGIAHLLGADRMTRTGTMIGTAAYTSPEQVHGTTATGASDVYSLGLVAIETITGASNFPGTSAETIMARLTRDPELPVGLPQEWSALLESMTARDAAIRPTALDSAIRAQRIAHELDGFALDPAAPTGMAATEQMLPATLVMPACAAAMPLVQPSQGRGPSPRARKALIVAAVVAALLVVGALALPRLAAGTPPPATPAPSAPTASFTHSPTPSPTVTAPGTGNGKGKGNGKGNP